VLPARLGAPSQNFRFRLRRPGAPAHFLTFPGAPCIPGFPYLAEGGPLGPSFNPGPLALWVGKGSGLKWGDLAGLELRRGRWQLGDRCVP
jgi:hypothetical protein